MVQVSSIYLKTQQITTTTKPLCQVCTVSKINEQTTTPCARLETGKPTTIGLAAGAYAFERFYQGPAPQEMEDGGHQDDVVVDGVDDGGDDDHY